MYEDFDYEILAQCQYDVNEHDCGEPATHKVWWADDMSDVMLVCQKHFEFIKKVEEE